MFEETAFAEELRQAAADAPAPRVDPVLAAVLDGSMAPTPVDLPVPVAGRRRHRSALSPRARLRLVLAGGVAAVTVLALAAGGSLPQPAQRNVSNLADRVGLDLPDGDSSRVADPQPDVPPTTPPKAPPAGVPTTSTSVATPVVVPEAVADDQVVEGMPPSEVPSPPTTVPGQGDPPVPADDGRGEDDDHRPEEIGPDDDRRPPAADDDD